MRYQAKCPDCGKPFDRVQLLVRYYDRSWKDRVRCCVHCGCSFDLDLKAELAGAAAVLLPIVAVAVLMLTGIVNPLVACSTVGGLVVVDFVVLPYFPAFKATCVADEGSRNTGCEQETDPNKPDT